MRSDHITPQSTIIAAKIKAIAPELDADIVKQLTTLVMQHGQDEWVRGARLK